MVEIILCECDWGGLGPFPPHYHIVQQWVQRAKDGKKFWATKMLNTPGYTLLAEVEEIHFNVPWKALWRAESTAL